MFSFIKSPRKTKEDWRKWRQQLKHQQCLSHYTAQRTVQWIRYPRCLKGCFWEQWMLICSKSNLVHDGPHFSLDFSNSLPSLPSVRWRQKSHSKSSAYSQLYPVHLIVPWFSWRIWPVNAVCLLLGHLYSNSNRVVGLLLDFIQWISAIQFSLVANIWIWKSVSLCFIRFKQ